MKWGRAKTEANIIYDTRGLFMACQRVAATVGLKLEMDEYCEQPCTDMEKRVVYVQELSPYWPWPRIQKWLGETYHEIGHNAPDLEDMLPFMRENNISFKSQIGRYMNLIEDVRNEKNKLGDWPGRDEALSWTQAFYATRGARTIAEAGEIPEDKQKFADVFGWIYRARGRWQPDVSLAAEDFCAHTNSDPYEVFTDELDAIVTAQDVYNLVIKIMESQGTSEEEAREEAAEALAKSAEGSELSEDEDDEDEPGGGTVSYRDLLGHEHKDDDAVAGGGFLKIVYDHEPANDYIPSTGGEAFKIRREPISASQLGQIEALYDKGRKLSGATRRLFQSRAQTIFSHNHKHGRLDKRDLYRIPAGCKDVFKRRENTVDPKGTAIFLLTDASGSMSGMEHWLTGASAALLNEALQPLSIPVMIAGFTETFAGPQHMIVKDFMETRSSQDIMKDYSRMADLLNQNADGESIMWAYNLLRARKEPRKILIVLSDGQPASYNDGDCWTYTRDVVHTITNEGRVECYGIGICDDSVKDFYPEYTVLNRSSELEQCLLDVVKHKILSI